MTCWAPRSLQSDAWRGSFEDGSVLILLYDELEPGFDLRGLSDLLDACLLA
jgi:hypothetical protein